MSLINKMLQDLDARGAAPAGVAAQAHIKLVLREERPRARWIVVAVAVALVSVALLAASYFGWRALQRGRAVAAPVMAPVAAPPLKTVLLAPLPKPAAPAVAPTPPAPITLKPLPLARPAAPRPARPAAQPAVAAPKQAEPAPLADPIVLSAAQRAEPAYRRALAALQEGRGGEAMGMLEQALQIDPRHEAARQTLVGLLIENKRPDDAVGQLQLALGAEPRQPAMAMLLARLQIERGGAGVDTLLRTLPYADGNAEYHALLAAALQRQRRHGEAAEQYQAALRGVPSNAVWLMGLGISLQADKRNAEALDAFGQARSAANLSPELQAFVERKLQQLSH